LIPKGNLRPGYADLVAGIAGGAFAPLASFGMGLPLWASLPGALAIFAGTRLALAPKGVLEDVDPAEIRGASLDFAGEVIEAAQGELRRLRASIAALKGAEARDSLSHLAGIAEATVAEVRRKPSRLSGVSRLLTYYLPAAARLGEGMAVLEAANRPDRARIAATQAMIGRLDEVFARHADKVSTPELDGLDVELRLLDGAIRSEEGAWRPADTGRATEGRA
jgi:hypothetical protein